MGLKEIKEFLARQGYHKFGTADWLITEVERLTAQPDTWRLAHDAIYEETKQLRADLAAARADGYREGMVAAAGIVVAEAERSAPCWCKGGEESEGGPETCDCCNMLANIADRFAAASEPAKVPNVKDSLIVEPAKVPEVCVWTINEDEHDMRDTACGRLHMVDTQNGRYSTCPYCGKTISVREG